MLNFHSSLITKFNFAKMHIPANSPEGYYAP